MLHACTYGRLMVSRRFQNALARELPVVFVNIGWTINYDGSETVVGNHRYLKENPGGKVGESSAFHTHDRYFYCGMGIGKPPHRFHVAFVARDPGDETLKVVGLYAAASAEVGFKNWAFAYTQAAERIPIGKRPIVSQWPAGQGMRRWATRGGKKGSTHKVLMKLFADVTTGLLSKKGLPAVSVPPASDEDALEGALGMVLRRHRKREGKLRRKKIAEVMRRYGGRLICEVPRCHFDFKETYGELGAGFAEVHHKRPLSHSPKKGRQVRPSELAVVCANCHRMIHHNGECRELRYLIAK
jgi:hypothetical protein